MKLIIKDLRSGDFEIVSQIIQDFDDLAEEFEPDVVIEISQPILARFLEVLMYVIQKPNLKELTEALWGHLDNFHDLICAAYERESESVYETIEALKEEDF
jgi:hypothetical protein